MQPITTTTATVTGVKTTVGAEDEDNIATFTFSPVAVLSSHGGEIVITAPDWYIATAPPLQAYRSTVQNMCSSDFLRCLLDTAAPRALRSAGARKADNLQGIEGIIVRISCRDSPAP